VFTHILLENVGGSEQNQSVIANVQSDDLWPSRMHAAGKPSQYVISHPGQLSLAIPPWVGTMSTSESWGVNRHTVRYTSPVSVVSQCKLVSG